MAVRSTGSDTKNTATTVENPKPADDATSDQQQVQSTCVVKADFHVGNATPGSKVCSYHAMHYAADGTRRP